MEKMLERADQVLSDFTALKDGFIQNIKNIEDNIQRLPRYDGASNSPDIIEDANDESKKNYDETPTEEIKLKIGPHFVVQRRLCYTQNDPEKQDESAKWIESKSNDTNEATSVQILDDLMADLKLDDDSKSYCKTALFYHSDCLLHNAGESHVERPERCSRSFKMLEQYGLLPYLMEITPREATAQELKGSHKDSYVEGLCKLEGSGWFDSDTFYNEHSSRAAKLAAGATIDVMAGILEDKFENGFALVRPPGHHCEHGKAMGFCLFNNAVVAVNEIRRRGLCQKVLIVDWDVHHGNGTQNLFYDDEDVLYFSTHRYDRGSFYPATGHPEETGNGFNVNVGLNVDFMTDEGHGDKQYLLIWKDILLPMVREFKPDIVLISAGFDASIGDPLGGMRITPPCYGLMTRLLLNECNKLAIVLEGGYNLDTMPRAIVCCHYALLKGPKQQKDAFSVDEFYEEFKENIIDDGSGGKGHEPFHQWFKDYVAELLENPVDIDSSVHASCRKSVQLVLKHHEKHWKFISQKLKEYENIDCAVKQQQLYEPITLDEWKDQKAANKPTSIPNVICTTVSNEVEDEDIQSI